jgi:phosphoglycerate dehydrogenase-like enzyme
MRAWLPYPSEQEARNRLGDLPEEVQIDCYTGSDQPLPDSAGEVEFFVEPYLSGRSVWEQLTQLPRLQVVQTLTAGYEHIRSYVRAGVTLCNAAGLHDASTAELAVALALAQGRQLDAYARNQTIGTWQRRWGNSIADKRVLIIGYGHIGPAIERRLAGFEVASITRVARHARSGPPKVHPVTELNQLLPHADVVILVTPLTPETDQLLDHDALALLPDGAQVINVGRGRLIDTDALVAETSRGRLTAALDVTDPEPLPPQHPLWTIPGVLVSPHVGGASSAFPPRADAVIASQLRRFALGQDLENVIE